MPKMLSLQHEIWNMGCTMAVVGGCVFAVNRILEQREIGVKKIMVMAACLFGAVAAWGQSGATGSTLSAQPQPMVMASHPQFAAQKSMGSEHLLLESSSYGYAQGERPLWEVAPPSHETPLGDVARTYKKEHDAAKKAVKVWAN
jgi:hypothetical protein